MVTVAMVTKGSVFSECPPQVYISGLLLKVFSRTVSALFAIILYNAISHMVPPKHHLYVRSTLSFAALNLC